MFETFDRWLRPTRAEARANARALAWMEVWAAHDARKTRKQNRMRGHPMKGPFGPASNL
jgi:hypothetical protein